MDRPAAFAIIAQRGQTISRWLLAIPRMYRLVLLTVILVGTGVLLVQSTMAQRSARNEALAEADAQIALEALNQNLVDAETGQRGYLLTLDPAYLEPYNRARAQMADRLADVKLRFMQDTDPAVSAHVDPLPDLVSVKLDELARTIEYARNGDSATALAVVRSNHGKQTMDTLRGHLAALAQIERARRDRMFRDAYGAEDRMVPLLLAMWAALILLVWTGYHGERQRALAEAQAAQAVQLRALNSQNELLARELAHRVRNLFGVVLSLVGLAARRPGTTAEVIADISGRIHSLGRAHSVGMVAAANEVPLEDLLRNLCEPYLQPGAVRITLDGPAQVVPARMVSPLALVVHELATNAAKYGALSVADGCVAVNWSAPADDQPFVIEWRETGGPPPAPETDPGTDGGTGTGGSGGGFGSRMTKAAVKQIGGSIEREWPASGAVVRLTIKLPAAKPQTVTPETAKP